jgi:pSer/pThr/pTyr-binding forkhead associated (FHA) protein
LNCVSAPIASGAGVLLRDRGSTNGTFVNGDRVKELRLLPGQTGYLGDVVAGRIHRGQHRDSPV